jgi:hypothetical protein
MKTILIVNAGIQGMNRAWQHPDGTLEEKHFPPKVPVSCSVEMGEYLLKKYCDPVMAIHFKRAGGKFLNQPAEPEQADQSLLEPDDETDDEEIQGYTPETPKVKRGRKPGRK